MRLDHFTELSIYRRTDGRTDGQTDKVILVYPH